MLRLLFPYRAHSPFREMREVRFAGGESPDDVTQPENNAGELEAGGGEEWDPGDRADAAQADAEDVAQGQERQLRGAQRNANNLNNAADTQPPAPTNQQIDAPANGGSIPNGPEEANTIDPKTAAEQDLGKPEDFAKLSKEQKEQKIADAMKNHGVNIEETATGYTVTAPEATDVFGSRINKLSGFFQGIALKLAPLLKKLEPMFKQFKKLGDQISGKKPEEPILTKEESSKERVQEKMKAQPDTAILETEITTTRDTAKAEKEKAEKEKNDLEAANTADRQSIEAFRAEIVATNASDKDVIAGLQTKITILEGKIKANETKIGEVQKKIDEQKKIVDEAELDLKSLAEIQKETRKEKEEKKVASIPDDGKSHEASEIVDGEAGWEYKITPDGRALMHNPSSLSVRIYQPETGLWVGPQTEKGAINNAQLESIYNSLRRDMTHAGEWHEYSILPNIQYSIDLTDGALLSRNVGNPKVYKFDTNTQKWNDVGTYDHGEVFNKSEKGKNSIQQRNTKMNEFMKLVSKDAWTLIAEEVGGEAGCMYIIGPKGKAYKQSADKSILVYDEGTASWKSPADVFKIPNGGRDLNNKYNQLLAHNGDSTWLRWDKEIEFYSVRKSDGAMMRKWNDNVEEFSTATGWVAAPGFDPAKQ